MLVIGLGNPGVEYKNTYHNVGFTVVEEVLVRLGKKMKETNCHAEHVGFYSAGQKAAIATPSTYMNLSGKAVCALSSYYGIPFEKTLIVYDDIDLPAGSLRVRKAGSGGTHNGMKNIVQETHTVMIPRLRVGIGKPEDGWDLASYVLSKISGENAEKINAAVGRAAEFVIRYLEGGDFDALMTEFNS